MNVGVRGKLFLVFLLADFILLIVVGLYLDASLKSKLEEDIRVRLSNHAQSARLIIRKTATRFDSTTLDPIAEAVGSIVGERITLIDHVGRVVGDSHIPMHQLDQLPSHQNRPEVREALAGGTGVSQRHSMTIDDDMVYLALPVELGEELGVVRVATSFREVGEGLGRQRAILALAGVLALGLAALMTALVAEVITRPFRTLASRAAVLTNDFTLGPLPVPSRDELGGLAGSFNQLTAMLEGVVTELVADRTRMGAVLQYMGDGVVALDRERRLTLINPQAQRLMGLDSPQLGEPLMGQVGVPELQELLGRSGIDALCGVEMDLETADHHWLTVLGSPLLSTGGCVLVVRDVTETRRIEKVQREFVANVSHELRTPVHAILLHAELLQEALSQGRAHQSGFPQALERNARRLGRIIEDLLYLSRLDAERKPPEREVMRLRPLCEAALELLLPLARDKGIGFEIQVEPHVTVITNAKMLSKVLFNLMENALKHCPAGSRVTIRWAVRGGGLRLEVEDDGPGVPPQHRERLFERFYRAPQERTRSPGGTGLGLAIVSQLVNRLGGAVGMEPVSPHGSRFWIRLEDQSP